MTKRIIALALVLLLAISVTGCGKSNSSETNSKSSAVKTVTFPLKETQTFTALACISGANYPYETNESMLAWSKFTNVKFDFTSVLKSDLTEKRNLMVNSKQYPEILFKCNMDAKTLHRWGKQGVLIELTDLINNYAPNLKAILDERNLWGEIQDGEGKIYALPEIGQPFQASGPIWINQTWMNNLGIKEQPKNLDEFYNVLLAFKTKDPNKNGKADEVPLGIHGDSLLDAILIYMVNSYDPTSQTALDDKGNLFYVPTSDVYKDALAFLAKCYSAGLCLDGAFTMDTQQVIATGSSGDVFGCVYVSGAASIVGTKNCENYVMLHPFDGVKMQKGTGVINGTFCITDKCKNPEIAIAAADYLYSKEGSLLTRLGVENVTYTTNSDGSWDFILNSGLGDTAAAIRNGHTLFGGVGNPGLTPDVWYSGMTSKTNPSDVIVNKERALLLPELVEARPTMLFNDEDAETSALIIADASGLIRQYAAKVIIGSKKLEDTWNEYKNNLKKMDIEQLEKIYSDSYSAAVKRAEK